MRMFDRFVLGASVLGLLAGAPALAASSYPANPDTLRTGSKALSGPAVGHGDGRLASPRKQPRTEAEAATHGAAVLQPGHRAAPVRGPQVSSPYELPRSAAEAAEHGRRVTR